MNSRVLSFDFGLRRIGVASGNLKTRTSQPLTTLSAKNGIPDSGGLNRLLDEWKPGRLVVGLPLSMDGNESTISNSARGFGKMLEALTGLPVSYVDERLTSVSADNILRESIAPGKKMTKKHVAAKDNLAAQLILQSYFDQL